MNWTKILTVVLESSPIWAVALGILYSVWRRRQRQSAAPAKSEDKESGVSDALYCTKCHFAWTGISSPHVSEERAAAFREMRCPLNSRFGGKCGGALRKAIPGERFGLEISAYRPPSIFTRLSSGKGKTATS